MKKLPKKLEKAVVTRPEWLNDPDMILFVRDEREPIVRNLNLNVVQGAGLPSLGDWAGSVFSRPKKDVREDWEKMLSQMHFLLEGTSEATKGYELSELTFNLGFSAEGSLAFIAKAGVTAGISVKFTKKPTAE